MTLAASYTSLIVIGLMAGPDNPPVVLHRRDLRLCASIHNAGYVFAITRQSVISASAVVSAYVISTMWLTFGESFTQMGRRAAFRAASTTAAVRCGSVPYSA